MAPRRTERRRPELERGPGQLDRSLVADRGGGDVGRLPQAIATVGRRGALARPSPTTRRHARDDRTPHPGRPSRPHRRRRAARRTPPSTVARTVEVKGELTGPVGSSQHIGGLLRRARRRCCGADALVAAGAGRRRRPHRAAGAGTGRRRCRPPASVRRSRFATPLRALDRPDRRPRTSRSWVVSRPIAATAPNTRRAVSSRSAISAEIRSDSTSGMASPRQVCGDELAGEERVAPTPRDDLVDERARRRLAEQRRDTLARSRRDPVPPGGCDVPPGAG